MIQIIRTHRGRTLIHDSSRARIGDRGERWVDNAELPEILAKRGIAPSKVSNAGAATPAATPTPHPRRELWEAALAHGVPLREADAVADGVGVARALELVKSGRPWETLGAEFPKRLEG